MDIKENKKLFTFIDKGRVEYDGIEPPTDESIMKWFYKVTGIRLKGIKHDDPKK